MSTHELSEERGRWTTFKNITDVVDTSLRDPGNRLSLCTLTVTEGAAGIFRWIIGFALFFLSEAMVVWEKNVLSSRVLGRRLKPYFLRTDIPVRNSQTQMLPGCCP